MTGACSGLNRGEEEEEGNDGQLKGKRGNKGLVLVALGLKYARCSLVLFVFGRCEE